MHKPHLLPNVDFKTFTREPPEVVAIANCKTLCPGAGFCNVLIHCAVELGYYSTLDLSHN